MLQLGESAKIASPENTTPDHRSRERNITSSPWAVTLSCQDSYISNMTYKHSKLGRTI